MRDRGRKKQLARSIAGLVVPHVLGADGKPAAIYEPEELEYAVRATAEWCLRCFDPVSRVRIVHERRLDIPVCGVGKYFAAVGDDAPDFSDGTITARVHTSTQNTTFTVFFIKSVDDQHRARLVVPGHVEWPDVETPVQS